MGGWRSRRARIAEYGREVTRREVWLQRHARDLFVQHLYLGEEWVEEGSWMKTDGCFCNDSHPLTVIFVEPHRRKVLAVNQQNQLPELLVELKRDLRRLYGIGARVQLPYLQICAASARAVLLQLP